MALNDWTNELEVYQHVKSLEKDVWSFLLLRNDHPVLPIVWNCSTQLAQNLRTKYWQRNIEGTTMPPFMEMLRVTPWTVDEVTSRTILIYAKELPTRQMFYARGDLPYYGSLTQKRLKRSPIQILEVGNKVSAIKILTEIKQWIGRGRTIGFN